MYEHVTVEHIDPSGTVFVGCDAKSCENCSGSMFCNVKHKTFPAKNPDAVELQPGDIVELYLPPGKTVFSTFLTLMVPLALFPAGYYLAGLFTAQASELMRFFFGIGGVAVGFLFAWLFFRKRKNSYLPVVTSVVKTAKEAMEEEAQAQVDSLEMKCDRDCANCGDSDQSGNCTRR